MHLGLKLTRSLWMAHSTTVYDASRARMRSAHTRELTRQIVSATSNAVDTSWLQRLPTPASWLPSQALPAILVRLHPTLDQPRWRAAPTLWLSPATRQRVSVMMVTQALSTNQCLSCNRIVFRLAEALPRESTRSRKVRRRGLPPLRYQ